MVAIAPPAGAASSGWTVHVDFQPRGPVDEQAARVIAGAVEAALPPDGGVVFVGRDRVSAHLLMRAGHPAEVMEVAGAAVTAVRQVVARHADVARLVAVEVVADDEAQRRLTGASA